MGLLNYHGIHLSYVLLLLDELVGVFRFNLTSNNHIITKKKENNNKIINSGLGRMTYPNRASIHTKQWNILLQNQQSFTLSLSLLQILKFTPPLRENNQQCEQREQVKRSWFWLFCAGFPKMQYNVNNSLL